MTTNDLIRPDVVIRSGEPLPFVKASFDRCFMGHVLEHVPWADLPVLLAEVLRVVRPGGLVCVVGPDLFKSLDRLIEQPDAGVMEFVRGVIEDDLHHQGGQPEEWPGARHHWNCYESRVMRLLQGAGLWDVAPVPIHPDNLAGWPVVDFNNPWQCAVTARVP